LAKYRVIDADVVADVMIREAKRGLAGRRVLESDSIQAAHDKA
jgi:hypothetical protein